MPGPSKGAVESVAIGDWFPGSPFNLLVRRELPPDAGFPVLGPLKAH